MFRSKPDHSGGGAFGRGGLGGVYRLLGAGPVVGSWFRERRFLIAAERAS